MSRGGEKLAHALDALGVDPAGKDCLMPRRVDPEGSPAACLQRGAGGVIALDVGYGQLHPRLRDDARVTVLERVNARHLAELPFAPELVTCDVSFISATRVLPAGDRARRARLGGSRPRQAQFEAGRAEVPKGVVRDPEVHRRVLRAFCAEVAAWHARVAGVVDSGHRGRRGTGSSSST